MWTQLASYLFNGRSTFATGLVSSKSFTMQVLKNDALEEFKGTIAERMTQRD